MSFRHMRDMLLDFICRKERKNDYLRRIEEIHRDLYWIGRSPFDEIFTRHKISGREEDIAERVKALCDFAEISMKAWKSSGLADVALEFSGAWRRLKSTDCQECGAMPPWHMNGCGKMGSHCRTGARDAAPSDQPKEGK